MTCGAHSSICLQFKEEDETLVGGLERLERRFPEYNRVRLKEVERSANTMIISHI